MAGASSSTSTTPTWRPSWPAEALAGATLRWATGTVLYLGLIALFSLGVTLLVRDAAVALTTVVSLLYLAPVLAQLNPADLSEVMLTYAPMNAGLAV
jgi:ABC-2 type transport system permease protein